MCRSDTLRTTGSAALIALLMAASVLGPAPEAAAQGEPEIFVTVDPPAVALGGTVQYTLRLQTGGHQDARLTSNPGFGSLEVLGTSRGTEFVSTPTGAELSYTFTFTLRATAVGDHAIEGPGAVVGGKALKGREVKVIVVDRGESPPVGAEGTQAVFIKATFSNPRPYVGEQVQAEYAMYLDERRVGPFGVDVVDLQAPAFDGFWIENLGEQIRASARRAVVGDREYAVRPIQIMSIFPLRAGEIEIGAMKMEVEASGRNSLRRQRLTLTTEPDLMEVRPLPAGAPGGFSSSNVGQYRLKVTVDKAKVGVGEPLMVQIKVEGTGMIGRLKLPELPEGEGYRLLEPVERKNSGPIGQLMGGDKTAEVVVTPTRAGVLTIPALTLHTFEPTEGRYVSQSSRAISVAVTGTSVAPDEEVELVERDVSKPEALRLAEMPLEPLRPLAVEGGAGPGEVFGEPWFLLGLVGPPSGFLAWVLVGAWRRRWKGGAEVRKRQSAPKLARAQFKEAAAQAAAGQEAQACATISAAMTAWLASALELAPGGVTASRLSRLLPERGVSPERVAELLALREVCDQARFGGALSEPAEALVVRAQALLDEIEGAKS